MTELLPFLITGLVSGSLYGLAGMGLVLTYRTSGVFNFGHGAIAAGAAYLFYTLHYEHGLAWPLAGAVTLVLFGVVVGWVMERVTRGLAGVSEAVSVVATVGILLAIQGFLFIQYGTATRSFPDFLPTSGYTLSGVTVTWAKTISFLLAAGCSLGLYLFLRRSRLGVAMRAVVDNPTLVALSGDRPARVRLSAWVIGSAFAAMSGILLAPSLGLDANLLALVVVQAFGACAIGLFTSLPMTFVGGLVVGLLASIATKYITEPPWTGVPSAIPFIILLVVLLAIPPSRLPRSRASHRRIVPEPAPMRPRTGAGLAVVGLGVLALVPFVTGTKLPVWINGLVLLILFSSLALLVWVSGQISLCHAAFAAVGASTMGHLTTDHGVPWLLALFLAGLVTVPVGALVAIPAVRTSGLYLALATLGFGLLMQNLVYPTFLMFGSQLSVSAPRPQLGSFDGANDKHFYFLVLGLAAACIVTMVLIARSRLGRLLRSMAEAPTMLATHGLGVNMTRLIAFCISAFFAGIAGGLVVTQFGAASGVSFGLLQSLIYLAVLAICGTRLVRSPILAAGLMGVLPVYIDGFDVNKQILAFGVLAIVATIVLSRSREVLDWIARSTAPAPGRFDPRPRRAAARAAADGAVPVEEAPPRSRVPAGLAR